MSSLLTVLIYISRACLDLEENDDDDDEIEHTEYKTTSNVVRVCLARARSRLWVCACVRQVCVWTWRNRRSGLLEVFAMNEQASASAREYKLGNYVRSLREWCALV